MDCLYYFTKTIFYFNFYEIVFFFKQGCASCAEGFFELGMTLEMGTTTFLRLCQWAGGITNILKTCRRTIDQITCSFQLPQKQSYNVCACKIRNSAESSRMAEQNLRR